jgi:hypothetical protein
VQGHLDLLVTLGLLHGAEDTQGHTKAVSHNTGSNVANRAVGIRGTRHHGQGTSQ